MPVEGYIKAHRSLLESQVFQNEGLFKVWMWCLLKATYKERWISLSIGQGISEVKLHPGQFIFGRESAAKELKMKPSTVHDRMQKLKKAQNIDIQTNSHYSLITVINWNQYQEQDNDEQQAEQQPSDSRPTAVRQPSDTNKKVKNKETNKKQENLPPPACPFEAFTEEEISASSDIKIQGDIVTIANLLAQDKFPKVFQWIQLKRNFRKNNRAILHCLNRCYLADIPSEKAWPYCETIINVENGNYNEQDAIQNHQ